jgi:uncharacterized protein (DUF1800 family)
MRRVALAVVFAILVATAGGDAAAERFAVTLPPDRQAVHVLNRLAFGPRPGDVEAVRRLGVEVWIRQQLDPHSIPDSPLLIARLAPLQSLTLPTWQIFETYQIPQPQYRTNAPTLDDLLHPEQRRRLLSGTPDERRAVVGELPPELRLEVLAVVPPNVFDALPDLKQQGERAQQIQEEIRRRQFQKAQQQLRPPLDELLTPEQARDLQRGTTDEKRAVLATMTREQRTLVFRSLPPSVVPDEFTREALAASNPPQAVLAELVEAKLQRAVYSPRQLEEVLVDFWFNHFNVFSGKGPLNMLLPSYERDAIRPFVLGRFRDMVLATARHPAMLFYLDNHLSRAAPEQHAGSHGRGDGVGRARSGQGINENYARELMELHTLGVDGGYTQDDVVNVARAFTGWTIFQPNRYGEFHFNPMLHDRGEKVVLGHRFPRGGGEEEGVTIIDLLAAHPSTARFISRKLAQRFVADDPPQALVNRMAATFTKTGGDLRAVMETLLLSPEFLSEGAWQAKMKTPFEFAASALRALDADVRDTSALGQQLAAMNQPLYGRVDPNGYPDEADAWSASVGLLARMKFAHALVSDQIAGVTVDTRTLGAPGVGRALLTLIGIDPAPDLVTAIQSAADGDPAPPPLTAVVIGSPDFQKR